MRKLMKKLETIYAAAAFAEASEFETAREILRPRDEVIDRKNKIAVVRKERRINVRALKS
jgi:hypothetical protein